jgi:hypothetical protein
MSGSWVESPLGALWSLSGPRWTSLPATAEDLGLFGIFVRFLRPVLLVLRAPGRPLGASQGSHMTSGLRNQACMRLDLTAAHGRGSFVVCFLRRDVERVERGAAGATDWT